MKQNRAVGGIILGTYFTLRGLGRFLNPYLKGLISSAPRPRKKPETWKLSQIIYSFIRQIFRLYTLVLPGTAPGHSG